MSRILILSITEHRLTCTESGLLVFKLIEGEFARTGGYVDVIMDDMAYASYSSAKIRSNKMTFNDCTLLSIFHHCGC